MLGYVIDESIQVGDMCWQGPLKLVRGQMAGALFTSADNDVLVIPDVPNLAHIARFLADHPETVDALELCHSWLNGIDVPWPDDLCEAATRLLELKDAMRGEGGE